MTQQQLKSPIHQLEKFQYFEMRVCTVVGGFQFPQEITQKEL